MRRKLELRSYRHAVVYPEPAEPRKSAGRKDTKRWCRGKAGVEHRKQWVRDERFTTTVRESTWWNLVCTSCGRQFDWCTPYSRGCKCSHHQAA